MSTDQSGYNDPIYRRFMESQLAEGMALANSSDVLRLHVPPMSPPQQPSPPMARSITPPTPFAISKQKAMGRKPSRPLKPFLKISRASALRAL